MAKAKSKETSMAVIVWAVFMTVLAIGHGVFVYVLYSDQEAKDALVAKAEKEKSDLRAQAKEAELIARIHRVFTGTQEGAGDQSDLVIIQTEVKEGTKPWLEVQKLNEAAKKRGPEVAAKIADKFNESLERYYRALAQKDPMPPKLEGSFIAAEDFDVWNLAGQKQLPAPKGSMLDPAVSSRVFRDLALRQTGEQ